MNKKFVVEWTDERGVHQFRILSKNSANSYFSYLTSIGFGVEIYAA